MTVERMIIHDPVHLEQLRTMYWENRSEDHWSFEYITHELNGEWRWGTLHQMVIRDKTDGRLWGTEVKESSGDGDYCSINDESEIMFYPVRAVQTTSYEAIR